MTNGGHTKYSFAINRYFWKNIIIFCNDKFTEVVVLKSVRSDSKGNDKHFSIKLHSLLRQRKMYFLRVNSCVDIAKHYFTALTNQVLPENCGKTVLFKNSTVFDLCCSCALRIFPRQPNWLRHYCECDKYAGPTRYVNMYFAYGVPFGLFIC